MARTFLHFGSQILNSSSRSRDGLKSQELRSQLWSLVRPLVKTFYDLSGGGGVKRARKREQCWAERVSNENTDHSMSKLEKAGK